MKGLQCEVYMRVATLNIKYYKVWPSHHATLPPFALGLARPGKLVG